MPLDAQQITYGPWLAGVDYSRPAEQLPPQALVAMQNCRIGDAGQVEKRNGYTKYISSAIAGTPTLTACGKHRFSAASSAVFAVAGAVFYEDASGTWTDRTGGQTITAADDNTFSTANAAGTLCLVNGVDPPLKWTAAGGNIALLDVDSRFTWSKWVLWWEGRLFHANTSAGTDRVYYSDALDIETIGATSFLTMDEDITGLGAVDRLLTVHQENGIDALFTTGNAQVPLSRQRRSTKGAIAGRSIVTTGFNTQLYVRRDGIYEFDGDTALKISDPLDGAGYWDNVNKSRLSQSFAVEYPDNNEAWFFLPYGASQTEMNHVIIWNYRHRIWYGPYLNFDRNCAALIDDLPHAGGLSDGLLYVHDSGTNDNSAAIDAWAKTAAPAPISPATQVRWLMARHHFDAKGSHDVTVQQIAPGIVTRTDAFEQGGAFDAIEVDFTIGISAIGGESLMESEDTDLWGYHPSCLLRYHNGSADETFVLRQVELLYYPTGFERKAVAGVE